MLFNGIELREGMFVAVTGMNVKNENDIFVVVSDYSIKDKYAVCKNECCLKKVKLNGEPAKTKYSIIFLNDRTIINNPDATVKIITDLKSGKKEVNVYLKARENRKTVVTFTETTETVKHGDIVKFNKCLICGTFGEKRFGTRQLWSVELLDGGRMRLVELGKKGQYISTGETHTFSKGLTDKVLKENYLTVLNREEALKGDMVKDQPAQSTETVKIDVVEAETVENKEEPQEAETTATDSVKVVYNTDKNGIELYFDGKPSQLTLELLKANGWRWARYNKCWYNKDTEKSRQFVATFTATATEQKTLDTIDIEIDNPSKYTVSNELSKRENDGNWIFRTKEIDHNEELQKIFNSFLTRINEILPKLDKTDQLKLKRNFNYFMKKYHENYVKQLTLKANNPSWAVTGRSGRNIDKYNREMERLHKLTGENIKLYNIMLEKIEKAERKTKKVS